MIVVGLGNQAATFRYRRQPSRYEYRSAHRSVERLRSARFGRGYRLRINCTDRKLAPGRQDEFEGRRRQNSLFEAKALMPRLSRVQ